MIARAKTSSPRKTVKKKAAPVVKKAVKKAVSKVATKSAKTAKVAKSAKVAVRSRPQPAKPTAKRAAKPAPKKKVATPRAKTAAPAKQAAKQPAKQQVLRVVEQALDDMKAVDVTVLDVRNRTDIADTLIVASGTSDRHVRSIAQRVVENAKKAGFRPMGVEGEREGEWILVDLQDLILHIMLPRVREFYRLENLWDVSVAHRETVVTAS